MDFPAYVPAAVRRDIESRIDGDQREPHGWARSLASAESALVDAESKLAVATQRGDAHLCDKLRMEKADALKHRDNIDAEVQCLKRLAHDARMQAVYALLTAEFTEDQQWCNLIGYSGPS